jgi:hypothetical protein
MTDYQIMVEESSTRHRFAVPQPLENDEDADRIAETICGYEWVGNGMRILAYAWDTRKVDGKPYLRHICTYQRNRLIDGTDEVIKLERRQILRGVS